MIYDGMFNEHVIVSIGTICVSTKHHHDRHHKSVLQALICDRMAYGDHIGCDQ